jgi:hypothetical protein
MADANKLMETWSPIKSNAHTEARTSIRGFKTRDSHQHVEGPLNRAQNLVVATTDTMFPNYDNQHQISHWMNLFQ